MTDHLKASPPERHEEISRHLLQQAQDELDKGDILQASDKVWGAVTEAIKAYAQERGWNCNTENYIRDAARCIAVVQGRGELRTLYGYLEAVNNRLSEQTEESDELANWLNSAGFYIRELAALQTQEKSPDPVHLHPEHRQDHERRLGRLTLEPYVAPFSRTGTDNRAPEEWEALSRNQLELAQESLDLLDLERADVESWNSTACAGKALCQQRGWNHHDVLCLRAAVSYVAKEFSRKDLIAKYGYLETERINYFEHPLEAVDIRRRIEETTEFIHELAALRVTTPAVGGGNLTKTDLEAQEKNLIRLTRPLSIDGHSVTRTRR